jgi:hypothetical protein
VFSEQSEGAKVCAGKSNRGGAAFFAEGQPIGGVVVTACGGTAIGSPSKFRSCSGVTYALQKLTVAADPASRKGLRLLQREVFIGKNHPSPRKNYFFESRKTGGELLVSEATLGVGFGTRSSGKGNASLKAGRRSRGAGLSTGAGQAPKGFEGSFGFSAIYNPGQPSAVSGVSSPNLGFDPFGLEKAFGAHASPKSAGEKALGLLQSSCFFQQIYQKYFREAEVFGVITRNGYPDPFAQGLGVGVKSTPEDRLLYFQELAQRVSRGQFIFHEPPAGGHGPVTSGEARNLLSNWLVLRGLQEIISAVAATWPSPASFGSSREGGRRLLEWLRRDAPAGG